MGINKKKKEMKIILGSESNARKRVLKKMGYEFTVMPAHINEKLIRFDDPVVLTLALANAKADALLLKIKESAILITADQVVVCNGKILEKPLKAKEAEEFLKMYAKYPAETVTSVVVVNTATDKRAEGTDKAEIWFNPIPSHIIKHYIEGKDPFYHSGGFDHQHPLLVEYVKEIKGEPESISGLPWTLTERLINEVS